MNAFPLEHSWADFFGSFLTLVAVVTFALAYRRGISERARRRLRITFVIFAFAQLALVVSVLAAIAMGIEVSKVRVTIPGAILALLNAAQAVSILFTAPSKPSTA